MRRFISFLYLSISAVGFAYAVIATPEPVLRQLPDGSWQKVYIRGDEHHHYLTTLTGEKIEGTDATTDLMEHTLPFRQQLPEATTVVNYVPRSGKVRIPVLLVNFTDVQFSIENPVAKFDDLFNGSGGSNPSATGSVHDYFIASSDSLLNLEYDVYGPYDLSNNMAYYGGNTSSSYYKNIQALVEEAVTLAGSMGVDFSVYDNNNDGYIDNISIITAGYNEAEGGSEDCIWPHYSTISSTKLVSDKRPRGYLVISEYCGSGGQVQAGIGTYCHEFGHALGLPDLYNTQDGSKYTVGYWDVMCSGSYNNNGCTPPTYSAFERWVMGWLTPIQLENDNNYQLLPICTHNEAYLIAATTHNKVVMLPNPSEYFLLENRQQVGWDANKGALIGTGMMISHITFNSMRWERNTFNNTAPLGYTLECAYIKTPTSSSPSDLFPGTAKVMTWTPTLNDGTILNTQELTNIRQGADGTITFHYGTQTEQGFFFQQQSIDLLYSPYDGSIISYDSARIDVAIKGISANQVLIYASNSNFDIRLEGSSVWQTNGAYVQTAIPADSLLSAWIRYSPKRQTCTTITGYVNVETDDAAFFNQIEIQGTAPRPIYINSPEITGATSVASTSFTTHWLPQEDAEAYYLTLYSLINQASSEQQSFDTFNTLEAIKKAGWTSNFASISNVAESGKAVYFSEDGQYLISPTYILPCSAIRFWISNNYVSSSAEDVGGTIVVEGRNADQQWQLIEQFRVSPTTRNLEKQYPLTAEQAFTQFRISYEHIGGNGGVAFDEFKVSFDQTAQYVCSGTERESPATTTQAIFTNLDPATTYYFSVQAYEYKGCEAHYSPLSTPLEIRTLSNDEKQMLNIRRNNEGEYVILLPEPADGLSSLYVYNHLGVSVCTPITIPYGAEEITLPTKNLSQGNIYIVKLQKERLERKSASGKFYYY